MAFVKRAGQVHQLDDVGFWEVVKGGGILPDDLIHCTDGKWRRPHEVDGVKAYFPQPTQKPDGGFGDFIAKVLIAAGALYLAGKLLEPERPPRRIKPNAEPLSTWLKAEIRERDGYTCQYCGVRVRVGHIDHKNPRILGGSNRRNNLALACASCNLEKGDMTAQEFQRWLENQ